MKWVVLLAVVAGVLAWFIAFDRSRTYNGSLNEANRASQRLDAAIAGKPEPQFNQPWYEEHPVMFGGAVGAGVFVLGSLAVIADNTSSANRREHEEPPATSE